MLSPKNSSRPPEPHQALEQVARLLPAGQRRERFYEVMGRLQRFAEEEEMMTFLEAMGFITLLCCEVPERIERSLHKGRAGFSRPIGRRNASSPNTLLALVTTVLVCVFSAALSHWYFQEKFYREIEEAREFHEGIGKSPAATVRYVEEPEQQVRAVVLEGAILDCRMDGQRGVVYLRPR